MRGEMCEGRHGGGYEERDVLEAIIMYVAKWMLA